MCVPDFFYFFGHGFWWYSVEVGYLIFSGKRAKKRMYLNDDNFRFDLDCGSKLAGIH